MTDEGLIDADEATRRVTGAQLAQLMFPSFDETAERTLIATGMNASPGAAVGKAVFDSDTAVEWAERGEDVILVRKETNPDDLRGMVAAKGILTSRGGKTSHAAVVARGMGRTCVCGAESLDVSVKRRRAKVRGGDAINEGDVISIDGTTGEVFLGAVPVVDSSVMRYFEGDHVDEDIVHAVDGVMKHADDVRRLRVRANADTPEDAARARRFGAEGIGLCRTEHMFLGDRRQLVENLIVAEDEAGQEAALSALLPLQRDDFRGIFEAMDGLPVTIRLIDPPLHEFLPDFTDLSVKVALEDDHDELDEHDQKLLEAVKRLHEQNPMLGLRGVRLGIVIPGLFAMQVRAILEAAAERIADGGDPQPEIMIPLVASVTELDLVRDMVAEVATSIEEERGQPVPHKVGTMIELPRAAVTAHEIAEVGRVLLLRHQRPDPDDVGLLARRRRVVVLQPLPRRRHLPGQPVREPRRRRRRPAGAPRHEDRPQGQPRPAPRGVRRARRRPGVDPLLRRGRARLRVLLPVPGAGRPARGGPLRAGLRAPRRSRPRVGSRPPGSRAGVETTVERPRHRHRVSTRCAASSSAASLAQPAHVHAAPRSSVTAARSNGQPSRIGPSTPGSM